MKNIKTVRVIGVTPLCAIFILLATGSLVAQKNPSFQAHKEFSAVPPFTPGAPGVLAQGDFGAIDSLDVHTGKSHRLGTFNRKFPAEIHWSPDGRTLFANYEQTGANFRKGAKSCVAHALGLFAKRQRNVRAALEKIIKRAGDVEVTAPAVVAAVQAYSKINALGQWVDRSEHINLNELFERMTLEEKGYAGDGTLPSWFEETVVATPDNGKDG